MNTETPVTVITNRQERPVIYWRDLTDKERSEFDYLDTELAQDEAEFVRYRGCAYDLSEFMAPANAMSGALKGWDGYMSDSYFSGVLIRFPRDGEELVSEYVICGRYYA